MNKYYRTYLKHNSQNRNEVIKKMIKNFCYINKEKSNGRKSINSNDIEINEKFENKAKNNLTWATRYKKKRFYDYDNDIKYFRIHKERKKAKDEFLKNHNSQLNSPPSFELKIFRNNETITLQQKEKFFSELNLHPQLLKNLNSMELNEMTEIQKNVIKLINDGKDVMGCSKTGSGKTIAFLLPIVNKLLQNAVPETPFSNETSFPVALILAPTRELAEQIYAESRKICHKTNIIVSRVYGGVPFPPQLRDIRNGVDIVVATPGRFNDLTKNNHFDLSHTTNLIIDEADRMLDMGFEPQIDQIINGYNMPRTKERQNLFFSATFAKEVRDLAKDFMNDYYMVSVNNTNETLVNENIKHKLIRADRGGENNTLLELLKELEGSILIFCETKRSVDNLEYSLRENNIKSASIHGDKNQNQRQNVINDFSNGKVKILIATDVASRGIDFPNISYVINREIPRNIEDYVHRIGRTGRGGSTGTAITLVKENENIICHELLKILNKFKQEVPEWFREIVRNSRNDERGSRSNSRDRNYRDSNTSRNYSQNRFDGYDTNNNKNKFDRNQRKTSDSSYNDRKNYKSDDSKNYNNGKNRGSQEIKNKNRDNSDQDYEDIEPSGKIDGKYENKDPYKILLNELEKDNYNTFDKNKL